VPRTTDDAVRVPQPTILFWVIKLLSTGAGEAISDFFVKTFDPVPVVLVAGVVFAACFAIQITARRYVPWRYWLFVSLVAVFGTMVADATHIVVGVPYSISTGAFAIALAVVLIAWRLTEGTVSIHSVTTGRRELFYWATVLATFALGTALGDLTATAFRLGWLGSGILFVVLFAMPGIAFRLGAPATLAFWWAYVLTRPLGASFADWLGMPRDAAGLGLGPLPVGAVGAVLIVAGVALLQRRGRAMPALAAPYRGEG
jgi:uncharacterized membrane-anchored protein